MPRCVFSASPIWKPTVKHGLRLDIGSWKIIAMSLPISARRRRGEMAKRSSPSKARRSAVTVAVFGSRPMTASMATDLPEPDSPTIATHLAGVDVEIDAVDRLERAGLVAKVTERLRISSRGMEFVSASVRAYISFHMRMPMSKPSPKPLTGQTGPKPGY